MRGKDRCEAIKKHVEMYMPQCGAVSTLHGDLDQGSRMQILGDYKALKVKTLVATDVAARGLDISTIRVVVNFDAAQKIETHTHRIGRTGRAEKEGDAYTLLEDGDAKIAAGIVETIEAQCKARGVNPHIPKGVMEIAMKHAPFAAHHQLKQEATLVGYRSPSGAKTGVSLAEQLLRDNAAMVGSSFETNKQVQKAQHSKGFSKGGVEARAGNHNAAAPYHSDEHYEDGKQPSFAAAKVAQQKPQKILISGGVQCGEDSDSDDVMAPGVHQDPFANQRRRHR